MSKVIKTNLELDNSGTEYNNGSVITRKTQYLEPLTKETAKNYFLAGHDIYFVYNPDNNIKETWIKLCDDIDYLEKIILSCSKVDSSDSAINLILAEEMPAYFLGQKDLDAVIKIAQDRAQKVLDERG